MDSVTASSYKPPTAGLRHTENLNNVSGTTSPRKKYWPAVNEVRL